MEKRKRDSSELSRLYGILVVLSLIVAAFLLILPKLTTIRAFEQRVAEECEVLQSLPHNYRLCVIYTEEAGRVEDVLTLDTTRQEVTIYKPQGEECYKTEHVGNSTEVRIRELHSADPTLAKVEYTLVIDGWFDPSERVLLPVSARGECILVNE